MQIFKYFGVFIVVKGTKSNNPKADKQINRLLDAKRFASRRYAQFEQLFKSEFKDHNDLLNFYSYGCYCLNLGDRPLTGILGGYKPTDEIDETCFRWTKCNRCVLYDYGPTCLAEITKYTFSVSNEGEISCLDKYVEAPTGMTNWHSGYGPGEVPGCRRAVCECDKAQAGDLFRTKWDIQWHHFYGGYRFEQCKVRKRTTGARTSCCGSFPKRFPFDANIRQCCQGEIKGYGYQCPVEASAGSGTVPAGAFDDNIGRKKRSKENDPKKPVQKMNYNPNPKISYLKTHENNVTDYDMDDAFSDYNY